jgi:hypothetical protein
MRPGSGLTIKHFVFQSKASARIDPGRAGLPQAQSAIHVEWIVDCPGMFRIFVELRHLQGCNFGDAGRSTRLLGWAVNGEGGGRQLAG